MRVFLILSVLFFSTNVNAMDVYMLLGQSNMAGRAVIDDMSDIDNCYLLNDSDEWEVARNPLNRYSTIRKELSMQHLGIGYSFCKGMVAKSNEPIGLIVNARGGSAVEEWFPGEHYYEEAVSRARNAGAINAILWHQGENNAGDTDYADKLSIVFDGFKEDLGVFSFIVGEIKDEPVVNSQLAGMCKDDDAVQCVKASDLSTIDRWHFDSDSIKTLGYRYSDVIADVDENRGTQCIINMLLLGKE